MSLLSLVVKPLAYISLPVILLRSLASISPTCRYYIRLYVYMTTMATVGVAGSFLAAGMAMVGEKYNVQYVVGRTFYNLASRFMGIDVVIEGEEYLDTQPAVLMCNHQSVLDILTVGRIYPKRTTIVSKKSIQYTPLGPFMSMSGAVFVNRGNNASALRSLAAAGETVKSKNLSLWVYPEGTRHSEKDDTLLPFKKGGFHLAVQGGLPVIPIVTENYWRIYHKGIFEKGTIKVRVLPPVSTTGLTSADVSELANRVRDQMLVSLREISSGTADSSKQAPSTNASDIQKTSEEVARDSTPKAAEEVTAQLPVQERRTQESGPEVDSIASLSQRLRSDSSVGSVPSENGAETEEDEGMVLVGRPSAQS